MEVEILPTVALFAEEKPVAEVVLVVVEVPVQVALPGVEAVVEVPVRVALPGVEVALPRVEVSASAVDLQVVEVPTSAVALLGVEVPITALALTVVKKSVEVLRGMSMLLVVKEVQVPLAAKAKAEVVVEVLVEEK